MIGKQDFLSALRVRNRGEEFERVLKSPAELWVQVSVSAAGDTLIGIVDSKGIPQSASEYYAAGAIGGLLHTLTALDKEKGMDFSWTSTGYEKLLSTRDYPFLTGYLPACRDILVDGEMKPLTLVEEPQPVKFRLCRVGESMEGGQLQGGFEVSDMPVTAFVSDSYALVEGKIVAIRSVGTRFADAMVFAEPFAAEMTENFLSILYSDLRNVDVDYEGRMVQRVEEPAEMTPVLLFEKVDTDNSLLLRVTETVGNIPMDICENFRLTCYVSLTADKIYVRRLGPSGFEENMSIVLESIKANAQRREYREIWHEGNHILVPPAIASRFLYNSLAPLLNRFRVMGADTLKSYKIVAGKPKLTMRIGSGIDFLEGNATVEVGGEKFTVGDLLAQYSRNHYITLSDGNRAVMDSTYMRRLNRIFRSVDKKDDTVKISFFDLPEVMQLLEDTGQKERGPKVYRNFYEGFNALKSKKLTTRKLKAKLRDYQREGVKWIKYLYDTGMGGCLADDMGLGKTVQTIAMLTMSVPKANHPSLIVMPRSLLFNWQEEFGKFAPHLMTATYYGAERNLQEALKAEVILTSYAIARNDIEQLLDVQFDYVILDESQNIKNIDAQVTKAIWLLKGQHRLAISGTPIENNLSELYSLFHFLNPTMFGTVAEFNDIYAAPIQRGGDEDAAAALRRKIFPFILRRLKRDVLTDLPERTEQVLTVEMTPRQAKLYEERRSYYAAEVAQAMKSGGQGRASFELLQALMELRQIASVPEEKSDGMIPSPKIDLLMENMLTAVRNGHKVVAFYNFLAGMELTGERLERAGISYETMSGATRDRQRVVERFQNDPECMVLLMTVKTGGVGLNLTAADTVFVVEPWWNKAAEEQAINRLHRIGQKKAVNCYYLITTDTIEEKIRQLQEKKSALVDAVISSDTGGKSLSAEDIAFLLS